MGSGNGHAILSPSASGRWIQCPASVRMCRDLPTEIESVYAREGTDFHTLCEIEASRRILGKEPGETEMEFLDWALETEDEWRDDQLRYVEQWIALLEEYLAEEEGAQLYLEVVVQTGIPGCWGTGDAIIVYSDRVRVIDIKYGAGIKVSAIENPQARLYGVGALETLVKDPLTIREITNTIWQPRMNNLSEETLTRAELVKWRDDTLLVAELALGEDAPFGPSESACRFCPIAGECAPRARFMLAQDFGDPDILDGEEMAEAYSRTSALKKWIADIEDAALKRAYEEAGSVPGFKVIRSGGRRQIVSEKRAIDALIDEGYALDDVSNVKIATFGQLDKLVGADELQRVLGDMLVMSEGRLSLAKDSDPRPDADAVHDAQRDFASIPNEGEA
jgi:alkylated DNA nucleotide flippase Atl1